MTKAIKHIVHISLDGLKQMYLKDKKTFCYERTLKETDWQNSGASVRYTLIALIGLMKAREKGYNVSFDLESIFDRACTLVSDNSVTAGDLGLYLWCNEALKADSFSKIMAHVKNRITNLNLKSVNNMELSWIINGLIKTYQKQSDTNIQDMIDQIIDFQLKNNYNSQTRLFFHSAMQNLRQPFSSFADQIYAIYSLINHYKLFADNRSLKVAEACSNKICELQRRDGGWPWMYNAQTGNIVEDYEIYSVHQDSMAPMALLELNDCSSQSYIKYIDKGIAWLYGNNQLNQYMIDDSNELIYRSLRREFPYGRLILYINSFTSRLKFGRISAETNKSLEINKTCRPYHLGWILNAWCN